MPRKLLFLLILLILIVGSLFFLASLDTETQPILVEKPVIAEDTGS